MLLLGVDTSGRQGGLALARGDADSFELLEIVSLAGGNYSARFIPELAGLLERHHFENHDLQGFAVVSGPGSFTGLRVGLSSVKGLAEILHQPIAAVSMLEAIAAQTSHDGRVIAAFEAGRKELFVGEYDVRGSEPVVISESLLSRPQFSALLDANSGAELITTDMSVAELAGMHLHVKQTGWPNPGEIARLGHNKVRAGKTIAPEALEANYIRRSDAEVLLKKSC
jgi:tRNA threonylcarbamoyladenosine biosynthesis protein TsaB